MATATGPLNLMACVRESSPQELQPDPETARHETSKKRRFHPFRGLRRMFRRKVRHAGGEEELPPVDQPGTEQGPPLDSHRSRSTSELLAGDEPANRRRSGNGLYPCHSGLSVSHDSVFTAEQRTPHSSSEDLDTAQSSSSLSIQQLVPGVRAELFDAVRRRRCRGDTSEDDEDLGLPRSPCNSPTTADVLLEPGVKENPTKSRSTCSDGSLLSMGSSEMDEDSLGQNSGHSSKLSLHDKKTYNDNDLELDLGITAAPLSHSAARHKMAVRPKRTHGAPRRRRMQQQIGGSPLPTTPEVNEELSARSASPEPKSRREVTAELSTSDAVDTCAPAWLSATDSTTPLPPVSLPSEIHLKSSSLPPGLALSTGEASVKLSRSHSNAAYRQTDTTTTHYYKRTISASELDSGVTSAIASEVLARTREMFGTVGEEDEDDKGEGNADEKHVKDGKKEESFLGRLLLRRSGKKKKDKPDDTEAMQGNLYSNKLTSTDIQSFVPKRMDERGQYAHETLSEYSSSLSSQSHTTRHYGSGSKVTSRSSAASRQRIEPINLPPSPECPRKDIGPDVIPPVPAPRNSLLTDHSSANIPVSRMQISYSVSPPKPTWPDSKFYPIKPLDISTTWHENSEKNISEFVTKSNEQEFTEAEHKPKLKIAGLSSYQQRITQMNSDLDFEEREFSSLIATAEESFLPKVSVKKSQSFRGNVDFMSTSQGVPSSAFNHNANSTPSRNLKTQDKDYRETVKKSDDEMKINARHRGSFNNEFEDNLSVVSSKTGSSSIFNGMNEVETIEKNPVFHMSAKDTVNEERNFMKNVHVKNRNKIRETDSENIRADHSLNKSSQTNHQEVVMKKSSSLDSISSLSEVKSSSSPQLGISGKKSSSSDSISSYTQQVTGPIGSAGISITQTVRRQEESIMTTVAMHPTSDDQTSSEIASMYVSQQETVKPVELPRSLPPRSQQEREPCMPPVLTPRSQLTKRENRPIVTPEPQIPEFLRVQLNRVDSKPAVNVVLSTSAVFESDKNEMPRLQSRLRSVDEKPIDKHVSEDTSDDISKKDGLAVETQATAALRGKKESIGESATMPTSPLKMKKESITNETATPMAAMRVKRKTSKEELNANTKETTKSDISYKMVESSGTATKTFTQDALQRTAELGAGPETKDRSEMPGTNVKSQWNVPVIPGANVTSRKSSSVSVPPGLPLSPSGKPNVKKQSCSLDSAESRNAVLKKQKSFDFENITIVEKEQTAVETNMSVQETSYQEVIVRKKSLPWEIMLKKDEDNAVLIERPASGCESLCSQDSVEISVPKKTKSREFASKKEEDNSAHTSTVEKQPSANETNIPQDGSVTEVVLRKKSLSREIGQRKEEEPELLKVFARRSLKLKDSDSEALSQQVAAKARENQAVTDQQVTKSRDSDKENEGGDSPREERKKPATKEPLVESKLPVETAVKSTIGITLNNPRSSTTGGIKYQRCFSGGSATTNEISNQNNEAILAVYQKDNTASPEKRQRSRTVPESPRPDANHVNGERTPHRVWGSKYKENSIELNSSDTNTKSFLERVNTQAEVQNQSGEKEEANIPRFKRIQQRKEEWELRAQQAAKKTLP